MPTNERCHNCGSNDIEEDNARGDRVCTNCGSVLDDSLIVSEVQFEEVGNSTVTMGRFVASGTTGAVTSLGFGKFHVSSGVESREVTVKKARNEITVLCQQLQLTQHFIDTAVNFFRMALMRQLTRGRRGTHVHAACVYMACRLEETSHLLIDISDAQQICSYELGRTYLKLSHALCIAIPSLDPCLYILRFVSKLEFGAKTHEISMTALRIVQRMKKDTMHSGRRPTGLCGAAILIAARMHNFNRSVMNIVNAVKIHESTLWKRMAEFADTPSCALTMEEFMSIDLEAEHDPPAFRAARKRDRERIKKMEPNELTELQKEFDRCLDKVQERTHKTTMRFLGCNMKEITATNTEDQDAAEFIEDSNLKAIEECMKSNDKEVKSNVRNLKESGVGPNLDAICRPPKVVDDAANGVDNGGKDTELDLDGLNEREIDSYLMTGKEADQKNDMWMSANATYLRETKEKHERLAKEREEGKQKKRRARRKVIGPSSTAGEAIEKILQEKKISTKINYDILKSLTATEEAKAEAEAADVIKIEDDEIGGGVVESPQATSTSRLSRNYDYKMDSNVTTRLKRNGATENGRGGAFGSRKNPLMPPPPPPAQRTPTNSKSDLDKTDEVPAKRLKCDHEDSMLNRTAPAAAIKVHQNNNGDDDWDSDEDEDEDDEEDCAVVDSKLQPNEVDSIRDLLCKKMEEGDDDYYDAVDYDDDY